MTAKALTWHDELRVLSRNGVSKNRVGRGRVVAEADVLPFEGVESDSPLRAGDKLRAAREQMGLDRAALALRTKINERHLAALESGDFASLPARIYAVGFSRAYAGAVGLDGAEIAGEVRRELEAQQRPVTLRPVQ